MINRKKFYDSIRMSLFNGRLTSGQVSGLEAKLNHWEASKLPDTRWLAYMLATSYHETAKTMQPVEEYGRGKGRKYGKMIKMSGAIYSYPQKLYYGRGDVQLTWYENYELMGKLLKLPLLEQPELALDPHISTRIMFEGMTKGMSGRGDFTGKCLENYFNAYTNDPVNARRIINGTDRAVTIAGYYGHFLEALL